MAGCRGDGVKMVWLNGCADGTAEKSDFMDNFVVVVGETKFVQVSAAARHRSRIVLQCCPGLTVSKRRANRTSAGTLCQGVCRLSMKCGSVGNGFSGDRYGCGPLCHGWSATAESLTAPRDPDRYGAPDAEITSML
jgi:hypothetical protein